MTAVAVAAVAPSRRRATALRTTLLVAAMLVGCGAGDPAPAGGAPAPAVTPTGRTGLPVRSFAPAPTVTPSDGVPAGDPAGDPAAASAPVAPQARDAGGPPPFVPARITLPSGRQAAVAAADTATDGSLLVPDDPSRVGWWTGGGRPGDPYGSVVLAGHVDSRAYGLGVFAELTRARRGDVVALGTGDRWARYRVVSLRRVPKARLAADTDAFDQSGPARLVLITCGGAFDPATHRYADNVVVVAEPVDPR